MQTTILRAIACTVLGAGSLISLSAIAADAPAKVDQAYMTKAAGSGLYEVEVSRMAASKAGNADVKAYAEMLVKDHTAANDELKGLAALKGVTLPAEMPADKKKKMDKLSKSKNVDRDFIKEVGLADHKTDIALFDKASREARDADIKAFFAKTLPTLKEHRADAQKLSQGATTAMKH